MFLAAKQSLWPLSLDIMFLLNFWWLHTCMWCIYNTFALLPIPTHPRLPIAPLPSTSCPIFVFIQATESNLCCPCTHGHRATHQSMAIPPEATPSIPSIHQLSIAPHLGWAHVPLPHPCWSVDWLHVKQTTAATDSQIQSWSCLGHTASPQSSPISASTVFPFLEPWRAGVWCRCPISGWVRSFYPLSYYTSVMGLGERVWCTCPLGGWAFQSCLCSVLWPAVSLRSSYCPLMRTWRGVVLPWLKVLTPSLQQKHGGQASLYITFDGRKLKITRFCHIHKQSPNCSISTNLTQISFSWSEKEYLYYFYFR